MSKKKKSQEEIILSHLKRSPKSGITSMEAFRRYGITRLSGRIYDLKERGYKIVSVKETNKETGSTYARYILKGEVDV